METFWKGDTKLHMKNFGFYGAMACLLLLTGCATTSSSYNVPAYAPTNPKNVIVKVSVKNQAIYVLEGSRALLVTPTTVGKATDPTPTGNFRVELKKANKRSGSLGFWVNGNQAVPGRSSQSPGPGWHYEGYPLSYWVQFSGGYGFHEGSIWPIPHTHGCLHVHKNVVRSFFELVEVGTPVEIAYTQPEDETLGKNLKRPTDYNDPDPATSVLLSESYFDSMPPPHLLP
jgi:hypothetical protein